MFFTGVFLIVSLYFSNWLYQKLKLYNYILKNFTSPPRHPIMGTLPLFPKNPQGIFKIRQELIHDYGKNLVLSGPFFHVRLIVSDPKDVETILANTIPFKAKKSEFYKQFEPWMGTGLFTSYGKKYFARRKIITPGFHFSILDGFVEVMDFQSDIFIEQLRSKIGMEEIGDIDIYEPVRAFALDVIFETLIGLSLNAQRNHNSEYATALSEIIPALYRRLYHPFGKISFLYNQTENGKKLKGLLEVLHSFSTKMVSERQKHLEPSDASGKRRNFLDIILRGTIDGKPLSDADIREEVDTIIFGGHDTVTTCISFTLYLLARHADVQEKVYQEVMEVFGTEDQISVTRKKLNELTYMEMAIKESLRLFPPGCKIGRQLLEDTVIGGVNVPAGIDVIIEIYAMHHDPDNFPDPEKFDPERFNPNNRNNTKSFSYIPFSAGVRSCIGQKFAILEVKTTLAKVIMNYRLLPSQDVLLQEDSVLKSANGVQLKLESRSKYRLS